jgi:hypothetical protein
MLGHVVLAKWWNIPEDTILLSKYISMFQSCRRVMKEVHAGGIRKAMNFLWVIYVIANI